MSTTQQSIFNTQEEQDAFLIERYRVIRKFLPKALLETPALLTDDAMEEIMQQVAIKLLRALPYLNEQKYPVEYMNQVARNEIKTCQTKYVKYLLRYPSFSLDSTDFRRKTGRNDDIIPAHDEPPACWKSRTLAEILLASDPIDAEENEEAPWIIGPEEEWKRRELYSALHRLPLVEQEAMKERYQLTNFHPWSAVPGVPHKDSRVVRKRAYEKLKKDEILRLAIRGYDESYPHAA